MYAADHDLEIANESQIEDCCGVHDVAWWIVRPHVGRHFVGNLKLLTVFISTIFVSVIRLRVLFLIEHKDTTCRLSLFLCSISLKTEQQLNQVP